MSDLQALHEALQQREQELAAVVASQAVSHQQEEDLKQVAVGSCNVPQTRCRAHNLIIAQQTVSSHGLRAFALLAKEAAMHNAQCS